MVEPGSGEPSELALQRDPIREWHEQHARRVTNLDFEPLSNAPFRASFELIFDDPRIVRAAFSPGLTFRDQQLVKDGDDAFSLVTSLSNKLASAIKDATCGSAAAMRGTRLDGAVRRRLPRQSEVLPLCAASSSPSPARARPKRGGIRRS